MTIEAVKAIKMVYANTTKHDWPDDIWDAICQAIAESTDLDAICQDLQEKTYTQAMRIAELEAQPKREWDGLTDEDFERIFARYKGKETAMRVVANELKEKNT